MIALIKSSTDAITSLLSQQSFSFCCYGAIVFGLCICLLRFLRGCV